MRMTQMTVGTKNPQTHGFITVDTLLNFSPVKMGFGIPMFQLGSLCVED